MADKRPADDHSKLLISSAETIFSTMLDFIKAWLMASVFFSDRAINTTFCATVIVIVNAFLGYFKEKWKTTTIRNIRKSQRAQGIIPHHQLEDAIAACKTEGPYSTYGFTMTDLDGQIFGMKIFKMFGPILTKNDAKFNNSIALDTKSNVPTISGVMIGLFTTDITFAVKNLLTGFAAGQIFPLYVTKLGNYVCISRNDAGAPIILAIDPKDLEEFLEVVNKVEIPKEWMEKKMGGISSIKGSSELSIITIGDDGKVTKKPYPKFPFSAWVAKPKDMVGEMIKSFDPEIKVHKPGQRVNIFALVSGPPGTGKSSLARVLGTYFGRSIIVVRFNGDFEALKKTIDENQDKIILVEEFGRFTTHFGQESSNQKDIEKKNAEKKVKLEELIKERLECLKSLNAMTNKESPGIKHTESRLDRIEREICRLQGTESQFGAFLSFLDTLVKTIVLFCSNNPPKIDTTMQRRFTLKLELNYFDKISIIEMIQLIYQDIASKEEMEHFIQGNYPSDRYTGSNLETLANGYAPNHNFGLEDYKGGKLKLTKLREIMENPDFWPEEQDEEAKRFADKVVHTKPTEEEIKKLMKQFEIKTPDITNETKLEETKPEETKLEETKAANDQLKNFNTTVAGVTLAPARLGETTISEPEKESEEDQDKSQLRKRK